MGGKLTATPGYAETGHLSESFSSSSRRLLLLGVLVAAGALFYSVLERRDAPSRSATGGDFGVCSKQQGDAARACYSREVGRELATVGGSSSPTSLLTYSGPVSNDPVAVAFKQAIAATDALRTGTYSKTLTFTLSTTNP